MSWKDDKFAIFVLTVLYCLQGIPLGLVFGSLPFILGERLSFTEQATFSLAAYPYSLKLFWSPIVDSIYIPSIGRRKTWVFPLQMMMGLTMIYISFHITSWIGTSSHAPNSSNSSDASETLLNDVETHHTAPQVMRMTYWFFWLVFLTATQDIAVDGWALTMLKEENKHYQSTCQSFGQTLGYTLAFPVFLALSSDEICSSFFGLSASLVNIESFLMLCGAVLIFVNCCVAALVTERAPTPSEQRDLDRLSMKSAYRDMLAVMRVKHVLKLCFILITCRVAFACVDSASNLKLQKAGFPKETAGILVFAYVPFDLMSPLVVTAIKSKLQLPAMGTWRIGFLMRMLVSWCIVFLVYNFNGPQDLTTLFLIVNVCIVICYSFTSNTMFTSQTAFFAKVADSSIGGTYLTLLNTLANLGGTFPKYFVLRSIDFFTILDKEHDVYDCTDESHKLSKDYYYDSTDEKCYKIERDGYYVTCALCSCIGIVWIVCVTSMLRELDAIPVAKWKVPRGARSDGDEPLLDEEQEWEHSKQN